MPASQCQLQQSTPVGPVYTITRIYNVYCVLQEYIFAADGHRCSVVLYRSVCEQSNVS